MGEIKKIPAPLPDYLPSQREHSPHICWKILGGGQDGVYHVTRT